MQAGDRVMVFDSPGFPVDHYLYATVLTPSDAGAAVLIDHPGNPRDGNHVFVAKGKILLAGDVTKKAEDLRARLAQERDPDRRVTLMAHIKGQEFMATQLAE